MKTKIVINPKYKELEEFIKELPSNFQSTGETIQARRNIIKSIEYAGYNLNVKRYRKPIIINQIVYSFFRKPKAYKAYYNALEVLNLGFNTPTPVAYIEQKKNNLLGLSYFISIQLENVKEIRELYYSKGEEANISLLKNFAKYTAKLHDANILHLDYSPGNILFSEVNNQYNFSLVDINRMKFCKIDMELGCKNFCRLFEYDDASIIVATEYGKQRNFDVKKCIERTLYYKHQFEKKKERKKQLKSFFKKNK